MISSWDSEEHATGTGKLESDSLQEAYFDRNQAAMLVAEMATQLGWSVAWNQNPDDPDWPVLIVVLPSGQVSWHIPITEAMDSMTRIMGSLSKRKPIKWDGHDLALKRQRIRALIGHW